MASHERTGRGVPRVWLFDLDNTLHNASYASLRDINERMSTYIERELGLSRPQADALRRDYWIRYGATLLGVVRHHQVDAAHFLHDTHDIANLESRVHGHAHDFAALKRLPGRHYILSNAPRHYVRRVLHALGLQRWFDGVLCVEDMRMFGHLRPKPDARMLRRMAVRLKVHPRDCVLVEDTLEHQKAARQVGMRTVWVQRWRRRAFEVPERRRHLRWRPPYVDRCVLSLGELCRWPHFQPPQP